MLGHAVLLVALPSLSLSPGATAVRAVFGPREFHSLRPQASSRGDPPSAACGRNTSNAIAPSGEGEPIARPERSQEKRAAFGAGLPRTRKVGCRESAVVAPQGYLSERGTRGAGRERR